MNSSSPQLRLYAHRGSSATVPENTLEAFRQALADGATALELDVHRTADGHFVVAHDPDGARTAGTGARIRELTLSEIGRWNVAAALGDRARGHYRMPTLAEVLEDFPKVPISVDLKPNEIGDVPALLELLAAHQVERRVTVASFHAPMVRLARRLGYPGPTALTQGEVAALRLMPFAVARSFVRGQAAQIPTAAKGFRLDGHRFISRCRRLGLRADFWVINDPAEARRLLDRGSTGIMTDDPRRLAPVFA